MLGPSSSQPCADLAVADRGGGDLRLLPGVEAGRDGLQQAGAKARVGVPHRAQRLERRLRTGGGAGFEQLGGLLLRRSLRSRRAPRASSGRRVRRRAAAARGTAIPPGARTPRRLSAPCRARRRRAAVRRCAGRPPRSAEATIGDHGALGKPQEPRGVEDPDLAARGSGDVGVWTTSLLIDVESSGPSHSSSAGTTRPRVLPACEGPTSSTDARCSAATSVRWWTPRVTRPACGRRTRSSASSPREAKRAARPCAPRRLSHASRVSTAASSER